MIEIRKTNLFVQWLDALQNLQARARVQARIERLLPETPVMLTQLAKVSLSCESIMVPVIGCISRSGGES